MTGPTCKPWLCLTLSVKQSENGSIRHTLYGAIKPERLSYSFYIISRLIHSLKVCERHFLKIKILICH